MGRGKKLNYLLMRRYLFHASLKFAYGDGIFGKNAVCSNCHLFMWDVIEEKVYACVCLDVNIHEIVVALG